MKKLFLLALILSAGIASASVIKASGNASLSSNANWTGGVKPNCTTDAVDTAGFTVTDDVAACHLGDAVNIGVSCSASGGKFVVNTGLTVTFKGTGTTTAVPWKTVANCTMDMSAANINAFYDCAADYCVWLNNGIFLMSPTLVQDAVTFAWNNAGTQVISGTTSFAWAKSPDIYFAKIGKDTGGLTNPGPISNAANTGLGSFGDTSLTVSSGGFNSNGGTTHVEKSGCVQGWNPALVLTTDGDYCTDYKQGGIWFKSSSVTATYSIAYNYGSWFSWGGWSTANAANNSMTVDGTMRHCGSSAISTETSGMGLFIDDMYAVGMPTDSTRIVTFGNSIVFEYCARPLNITNDHITGSNSSHHYSITTPVFNFGQYNGGLFQKGMFQLSSISYLDVTNPTLNSYSDYMNSPSSRGPFQNIVTTGAKGGSSIAGVLNFPVPSGCNIDCAFKSSDTTTPISGFNNGDQENSAGDGSFIAQGGTSGHANIYTDIYLLHAYRVARLDNYMTVSGKFPQSSHHSLVLRAGDGYIDGSTITLSNIITADLRDDNNFPGCMTFAYNHAIFVRKLIWTRGTCDLGTRGAMFNDQEGSIAIITKAQFINSIISNSADGIFRPTPTALNVTSMGLALNDWNLDYNNTTNPTNVTQATFMKSGVPYNTNTKNNVGIDLFNPQGYTLPDATSRALVTTVSGTLGTRASGHINVAWGGGTAVDFIFDQGTVSSYSASGSCPDGTTCSQVTDSTASWTASDGSNAGLRTYQAMIVAGTGAGQSCAIVSNTTTSFVCIPPIIALNEVFATPLDATSKYIIIKPDQQLLDSGGVNSVRAMVDSPTMVLTSQTDSGITMALNAPTPADPKYVNPAFPVYNFIPTLATLKGKASDGGDIGALPVQGGAGCGLLMLLGVGC